MNNNNFILGTRSTVSFNCLIVGENGCGKTTFGNELLQKYILSKDTFSGHQNENKKDLNECLNKVGVYKVSNDCNIHLYESVDFGNAYDYREQINAYRKVLFEYHNEWNRIAWNTINEQELKMNDKRIHCIFYLVPPHAFKDRDLLFLEKISKLSPIVLVISKSDAMTINERASYLVRIDNLIKQREDVLNREILYNFKNQSSPSDTIIDSFQDLMERNNHSSSQKSHQMQSSDNISTSKVISSSNDNNSHPLNTVSLSYIDVTPIHIQTSEDPYTGTATASLTTATTTTASVTLAATTATTTAAQYEDEEEILYGLEHSNHYCDEIVLPSSIERYEISKHSSPHCNTTATNTDNNVLPMIPNIFAVINGSYIDSLSKNINEMTQHYTTSNRVYPWGIVSNLDDSISDFRRLQRLMFETGTVIDMINHTNEISIYNNLNNMHLKSYDHTAVTQTTSNTNSDSSSNPKSGFDSFFSGILSHTKVISEDKKYHTHKENNGSNSWTFLNFSVGFILFTAFYCTSYHMLCYYILIPSY